MPLKKTKFHFYTANKGKWDLNLDICPPEGVVNPPGKGFTLMTQGGNSRQICYRLFSL